MKKAASTRQTILKKAFDLIYKKGYQTTSIDEIIATTKVTKGAFYYHFKHKEEMGLAIISEILNPDMTKNANELLANSANPLDAIYNLINDLLFHNPFLEVAYGCPTGNLMQEVSPWNNKFRLALKTNVDQWKDSIENCIEMGKKNGKIRREVNAKQVAYFVMSGYWGIRIFGKLHNDNESYTLYLKELKLYLSSLR